MTNNQISLNYIKFIRILVVVAFLLVLASIGGQLIKYLTGHGSLKGLIHLFDVDDERNVPTAFSSLLLIFSALLLMVISRLNVKQKAPHSLQWTILSFGFFFLTYDEAFSAHEKLIDPIQALLGNGNLGFFHYAWVIPGIAILFVLLPVFIRFVIYLPAKIRSAFIIAMLLYIGGAIGMELIGGWYKELHGEENLSYNILTTIEESLEMMGLIVFIRALLSYIADTYKEVLFRLD